MVVLDVVLAAITVPEWTSIPIPILLLFYLFGVNQIGGEAYTEIPVVDCIVVYP